MWALTRVCALLLWLFITSMGLASAYCECGYSVNGTSDASFEIFTDLFENDFLHSSNLTEAGWSPQQYNVTPQLARGPYGKQFLLSNILPNPLKDPYSWAGDSANGGDAGLQLRVGQHSISMIPGAEMATQRTDIIYGSFRVGMKLSSVNGTCGAFFWFRNDSQEIDMEFLSKQFLPTTGAVNLVLQTPASLQAGYDASGTPDYAVPTLPFAPDGLFHEYRFDWSPAKVSFYADSRWLADMTLFSPDSPGHLVLNHWSNGDPAWSAGPPAAPATMTVSYVKAYFNSSDPALQGAYRRRCPSLAFERVCQIPDQRTPPDPSGPQGNQTARTYFFSLDGGAVPLPGTNGSTTPKGAGVRAWGKGWEVAVLACMPFLGVLMSLVLDV